MPVLPWKSVYNKGEKSLRPSPLEFIGEAPEVSRRHFSIGHDILAKY